MVKPMKLPLNDPQVKSLGIFVLNSKYLFTNNLKQMFKVKVTKDKNNNVITVSEKNPEFGHIRVEQEAFQITEQGWLKSSKRSAIIHGKVEDLVKTGYKDGTEIPGKVVIIESLKPFNQEDPDKNLKLAGETGIICRVDDQPIYRQTFFTPNQNAFDELISHTNTDEIREVMEAQRMMKSITKTRQEQKTETSVEL